MTPALRWLDDRLLAQGTTADEIVRAEHQGQGAMNVTVRNVITSMRMMSAVDWAEFFESVSLVDAALRADSDFAEMDFPTRDRYRHAIEEARARLGPYRDRSRPARDRSRQARGARGSEPRRRNRSPRAGSRLSTSSRKGGASIEKELGFRVPMSEWLVRANAAAGILGYVGAIAIISAIYSRPALFALVESGVSGWTLFILALLARDSRDRCGGVAGQPRRHESLRPGTLPALELHDGVPASLRTMVVVPTLLTTQAELEEQIERLEVHYLASQDGDLRFALLSDWTDSATENAPGDDELLGAAAAGIARLNERHGPRTGRRSISPAPSPANLERGGGKVDRMGTQARKAARAESLAARRDRHDLRGDRRQPLSCLPASAT